MQDLFEKYLNNGCSATEVRELLAHFKVDENETVLRVLIAESLETIDADDDGSQWNRVTNKIFAVIKKQLAPQKGKVVSISMQGYRFV